MLNKKELSMIRNVALVTGWLMLVSAAPAAVQTKKIAYKHGDVECQGYLAWDDAVKGPRPGVLVVHEWWGLNDYARKRAEQLAKLGYVAFAADMYGEGKVTGHPKEAGERAAKGRANVPAWRKGAEPALDGPGRSRGTTAMRQDQAGSDLLLLRRFDCVATGLLGGRLESGHYVSCGAAGAEGRRGQADQGDHSGLPRGRRQVHSRRGDQ